MMTQEQKIEWLKTLTDEQVIEQLSWAVAEIRMENRELQAMGSDHYGLVTDEILRRMKR